MPGIANLIASPSAKIVPLWIRLARTQETALVVFMRSAASMPPVTRSLATERPASAARYSRSRSEESSQRATYRPAASSSCASRIAACTCGTSMVAAPVEARQAWWPISWIAYR